jgi:peroxiredoxin
MMLRLGKGCWLGRFALSLFAVWVCESHSGSAEPAPKAMNAEARSDSPLGRQIRDFTLGDFRGKPCALADLKSSRAIVVTFVGVECPLVQHYAARLQQMADKYEPQQVAFLAIDSNQQDSQAEIAHFARTHKLRLTVLRDPGNKVADHFGAERTPEVFVLDEGRRIVYHGRIDDQFSYGKQKPKVERTYLTDAIDQLLAGKPIHISEAKSVGCQIGRVLAPQVKSDITYSKHIARIFQDRCVRCHRPGEIGPFSLTSYGEVVGWAGMIREVVAEGRMPPWHASPDHGQFINDQRLSEAEKQQISEWVAAGAPEGNPRDLPKPREFTAGWQIGQPDVVIAMGEKPFDVPAAGDVRYQYFVVDPGFKEDKWITSAECRPGNPAVVHHMIVGIGRSGSDRTTEFAGLRSDWITAMTAGARPMILRPGMAKLIPAGSKLVFQLHYAPNGTPQQDLSSVGFIFADPQEIRRQVGTNKAENNTFQIPPHAASHPVRATHVFPIDMLLLSMYPHMHLRGKSFRYTARYPDGREEILLDIPAYDCNWQNTYEFVEPKLMPRGTHLICDAQYDNSEYNLANPDPAATVKLGDQAWEEMMIGYFDATPQEENIQLRSDRRERTQQFLESAKSLPATLSKEFRELASDALDSDSNLTRCAPALRQLVPQIDRVCWTTIDGGKFNVRRCVQHPDYQKLVGGSGHKVDRRLMKVAEYADAREPVVNCHLQQAKEADLKVMARVYRSSVHIPVTIHGHKGTLNFWSTEDDAFPPEAVKVLTTVTEAMQERAGPAP